MIKYPKICERCEDCSGEDCQCCEVWLEDRENQRYQPDLADLEDELREHDFEPDYDEPDEDEGKQSLTDYESDTPFGQALADGYGD